MSQSSITAGALVIAWIIFITVRGELPAYFGALGLGPQVETAGAGASGGSGSGAGNVSLSFNDPQQAPIPSWGGIPPPHWDDPWSASMPL